MLHMKYYHGISLTKYIKGVFKCKHKVKLASSLGLSTNIWRCKLRNLKFTRNLKFITSKKTLVNSKKKMILCLKVGIFHFKKP